MTVLVGLGKIKPKNFFKLAQNVFVKLLQIPFKFTEQNFLLPACPSARYVQSSGGCPTSFTEILQEETFGIVSYNIRLLLSYFYSSVVLYWP